jgi:hypothetical protein
MPCVLIYECVALGVVPRQHKHRMPWHDIHCMVDREAARDVGHSMYRLSLARLLARPDMCILLYCV